MRYRLEAYHPDKILVPLEDIRRDLEASWKRRYDEAREKRCLDTSNPTSYLRRIEWRALNSLRASGSRQVTSAFYTVLIGHGYLKGYLYRLGKTRNDKCRCGAKEKAEHLILSCREYTRPLTIRRAESIISLLRDEDGVDALLSFLRETGIATRK